MVSDLRIPLKQRVMIRKVAIEVDATMRMHLLSGTRFLLLSDMVATPEQGTSAYSSEYALQKGIVAGVIMKALRHGIVTVPANSAHSTSLKCILASRTSLILFKMQIQKGKKT